MRRVTLIPLLLTIVSCSRDLAVEEAPGALDPARTTVSGVTKVEQPGEPLPVAAVGATIDVRLPDGTTRASAVSGADGRFALVTGAPPFTLHFQLDSNADGAVDRQLLFSSSELPILAGTDFSLGDVLLGRSVEVRGTIRRGDLPSLDVGHDGIQIEPLLLPVAPILTNSRGEFVLRGLPGGAIALRISAAGYLEDRLAIDASPGESVRLSDLSLAALEATPAGTITGTVLRSDGAPGDAIVEVVAVADGRSLARSLVPLDAPFAPLALPPGRYLVRAEISGLAAVSSAAFDLASLENFDVGALVIDVEAGGLVRDGAAPSWEPSSQQLLGALGPITASFETTLRQAVVPAKGSPALFPVLQVLDDAGAPVAGREYVQVLGPPDVPLVRTTVEFYPSRPFAPGRYVASIRPTVLDANDKIPPAAPVSWISLGVGVTPGPEDALFDPLLDLRGITSELPIKLQPFPDGSARLIFATEDPVFPDTVLWQRCTIRDSAPVTCDDPSGLPMQLAGLRAAATTPEAALFLYTEPTGNNCPGAPGGVPFGIFAGFDPLAAPVAALDPLGAPACGSAFELTPTTGRDVVVALGVGSPTRTAALHAYTVETRADGSLLDLVRRGVPALPLAGFPERLDVTPIGGERWISVHTRAARAGGASTTFVRQDPAEGTFALANEVPIVEHPEAPPRPAALCGLAGVPLAVLPYSAWDEQTQTILLPSQLEPFTWDDVGKRWSASAPLRLPSSVARASDVACVSVGDVAFVTALVDERLFAFWFDGARWEPIFARDTPDGALTRSGCRSAAPTMVGGETSALVAHRQSCMDGASLRLERLR